MNFFINLCHKASFWSPDSNLFWSEREKEKCMAARHRFEFREKHRTKKCQFGKCLKILVFKSLFLNIIFRCDSVSSLLASAC